MRREIFKLILVEGIKHSGCCVCTLLLPNPCQPSDPLEGACYRGRKASQKTTLVSSKRDTSNLPEQSQDKHDGEDKAHAAARAVAPAAAVGPGGQCADEKKNEDDQDNRIHVRRSGQPLSPVVAYLSRMESEPDIPCARVVEFVCGHVHDLRNLLNNLDLETGLLQELVSEEEAQVSAKRVRKQVRMLADRLDSLSAFFRDAKPMAAPIAARELLLIWREQHAKLSEAPEVQWVDELGDENLDVDVEMMVTIFREILSNAAAFSQGGPIAITMRREGKSVTFELREPKTEALDPSDWGRPFSKIRQGHYGLGLWSARRMARAHGATLEQRYVPDERQLITRFSLPVT